MIIASLAGSEESVATRLRRRYAELAATAAADDMSEGFPFAGMKILAQSGCMTAVLPVSHGGVGLGWAAHGNGLLLDLLRAVGGAHLSCARLFEGHVNAFQLLWTFGSAGQRDALCHYVEDGGILGVWNAPSPQGELEIHDRDGMLWLTGSKAYASGAGGIRRPLVTARRAGHGPIIVWPDVDYSVGPSTEWTMHGMRASMTRSVSFDGRIRPSHIFGGIGDYHAQPQFSGGAWRFLAAQLGAGEALAEQMRDALTRRGRSADPHQRARMAQCVIELETARKWVADAARLLSGTAAAADQVVQHANAARTAVERSLLNVIELAQRSIGLQLFDRTQPGERVMRDLATYLRQPAPDALLESIGVYAFSHARPTLAGGWFDGEQ